MINEPAPAKINLTLHVTGQRADGYHLLDSLVVFANIADQISVTPADRLSLTIDGPFAAGLAADDSNLVLRAARLLDPLGQAAIRLTKNLPVASGIGGGAADAAAALRALSRLWGVPVPDGATLGADVPACLHGRSLRLRGIGDRISDLPPLPALDIVLVNPGVAVPTPLIFKALTQKINPAMPQDLPHWPDAAAFCDWLADQRNDLLAPAAEIVPEINMVLAALRATGCLFAGMSGSGATCFALFAQDGHSAGSARDGLAATYPEWWIAAGQVIRDTT